MICVWIRCTAFYPDDDDVRVAGISLPDWGNVDGVRLLESVTYTEHAVFNCHQLGDLLGEIDVWRVFEVDRGDPDGRLDTIDQIKVEVSAAKDDGVYAAFGPPITGLVDGPVQT